jgi:leucyl aminopeptidase (aminopeptidase T)
MIKPILFSQPDFDVMAELGIGTNPNINADYIARKGWTILTAEKISGSAHFANGNSKAMGGKNDVPIHIDWVVPNVTIHYDFKP